MIRKKNSILKIGNSYLIDSPLPSNLTYNWNYGSLLGVSLVLQIITGVTLAMHYTPSIDKAFISVEHIMRDVNLGYIIRYSHANIASFFFIFMYLHIARGIYYGSYKNPRNQVWIIGVIIFILTMAIGFIGYTLPWGQMSLWGLKKSLKWSKNLYKLKSNKKNIIGPHNIDILSIIIVSMLGDSNANKKSGNTKIELQQEESNMEYLMWLHKYIAERGYCNPKKPKIKKKISKKGKIRYLLKINIYTNSNLNFIYDMYYKDGKKIVPPNIEEYLTPLGLAVWIMDDGERGSSGLKIRINSFKKEEVLLLCQILKRKYDLEANSNRTGNIISRSRRPLSSPRRYLLIPKRSIKKIREIVKDYIVTSIKYKLNDHSLI